MASEEALRSGESLLSGAVHISYNKFEVDEYF